VAVSSLAAAKTVCELREWQISNLSLQKIIYIAHMFHLGNTGNPLINSTFQAWDYGPVIPELYHKVKGFGSSFIGNVFHWTNSIDPKTDEFRTLKEIADQTRNLSAATLVDITHWKRGAWNKIYKSGVRGAIIPNSEILKEYHGRIEAKTA